MIPSPRFVLLISGSTVSRSSMFFITIFLKPNYFTRIPRNRTVQVTVQTFLQCRASRMNWSIATINDENISSNVHCTTVIVIVNLLLGINFMYFVRAGLLISFNFVSTVSTCYSLKLFFPVLGVFYSRLFEETCTSILIVETKWEGMNENLITKWGRGSTIRGRRR